MQVGDLVELSSAGRKGQQNFEVVGKIGLLIEIKHRDNYPYIVQWYGITERTLIRKNGQLPCKRYELKKLRTKR
tara:strand:+ start:830 stop:1051 length:222 start_codon:yes stop_codon:yes gene_type:complete